MKIELKEILRLHRLWLRGEADGKQADLLILELSGADLSGADLLILELSGADLSGADLRHVN